MEISYHREMKNNYLMIEVEESREQGFETKMLVGNTIEGLLKFRVRKTDNHCRFCYEITSKQPLKRFLETRELGAVQIRSLLLGIVQTLTRMEEYLLCEEQILLEPDLVYVDLENFQPGLCLLPGKEGDFPREMSEFLQFLLDKVDHQDKEAVVLIYGLYRESMKENYGLNNLMQWLIKEECPNADNDGKHKISQAMQQEETPVSELTYTEKEPTPFPLIKIIFCGMLMPVLCGVFWLWKGDSGLQRLFIQRSWMIAGGAFASLAGIVFFIWEWRQDNTYAKAKESKQTDDLAQQFSKQPVVDNPWQMVFCEEEPEIKTLPEEPEEDCHTVLLWSRQTENTRQLISSNGKRESISLAYFPFLIGKQENLTDYTISDETVSRLHVRFDKKEDTYFLTDLNSTNGTFVNGRKLDNNETTELSLGDQIGIADLQFTFQ